MTERIDLDDVEVATDEDEESPNEGEWLWGDADAEELDGETSGSGSDVGAPASDTAADDGGDGVAADASERNADAEAGEADGASTTSAGGTRVPHVPYEGSGKPAGIPKDQGGSGSGAGPAEDRAEAPETQASGPHGGGVDDMATAYTYDAVQRLENPRVALAEANEWSDWIGLVGDVEAHAINAFLREHQLDIDFFNGSGDGPAERLADIGEHSMFYSERMVVVGTDSEKWIADESDWEFVPLVEAASKAGWELSQ
jgi:hypothetical protein